MTAVFEKTGPLTGPLPKPKTADPIKLLYLNSPSGRKGYRYGTPKEFYEVFWQRVSDHYVIQEEWKDARKRDTSPLEIHALGIAGDSLDQRCLLLLKERLIRWGLPSEYVQKAEVEYQR